MRVWIDLANSPHVLFFAPLVREFERRGIEVTCTARDFAQTLGLARMHGLRVESIGRHGGRSALGKARETVARAAALRRIEWHLMERFAKIGLEPYLSYRHQRRR